MGISKPSQGCVKHQKDMTVLYSCPSQGCVKHQKDMAVLYSATIKWLRYLYISGNRLYALRR
ncbi:hypothetical protein TUM4442_16650 [Shewanella algae]|nr:hypothetical protein TUM4442_16650 [Shewanella algae]